MKLTLVAVLSLLAAASAEVYFRETFSDGDAWKKRWVQSQSKNDYGVFELSKGKFYADDNESVGLRTSQNEKFYAISAPLKKEFNSEKKDLVLQFTVKHEQMIDCGGGYLKLLPPGIAASKFSGDTQYNIMFGPDICGSTQTVHAIFHYEGENKLIKKAISAPRDEHTHLYTLIVKPDQTYTLKIDNKPEASGSLVDDWDFLPPKKIKDPKSTKPADWDERPKIPDPDDKKPAGWDDIPEFIDDSNAQKPEDWDDEMDGTWNPPKIANPEFKGEWQPKEIKNPNYKGSWKHPEIDNPDYKPDPLLHAFATGHIGIDLWQVKSGSIFDDILLTDDTKFAQNEAKEVMDRVVKERKVKEELDEESRKKAEEKKEKTVVEDGETDKEQEGKNDERDEL